MNYALIENGVVTNLLWLYPGNAGEFPGAVRIDEGRPVGIGDSYADGVFTRNGESVLTEAERLAAEVAEYDAALTEIETALGVNA